MYKTLRLYHLGGGGAKSDLIIFNCSPPADRDTSLFQLVGANPVMYFCPSLGPAQVCMCKQTFPNPTYMHTYMYTYIIHIMLVSNIQVLVQIGRSVVLSMYLHVCMHHMCHLLTDELNSAPHPVHRKCTCTRKKWSL